MHVSAPAYPRSFPSCWINPGGGDALNEGKKTCVIDCADGTDGVVISPEASTGRYDQIKVAMIMLVIPQNETIKEAFLPIFIHNLRVSSGKYTR
jgi:hypothetical protein